MSNKSEMVNDLQVNELDSDHENIVEIKDGENESDLLAREEAEQKLRREREARAQALTLEIVGDLPFAEVKPPENVLFVCKLNPVTGGQQFNNDILGI